MAKTNKKTKTPAASVTPPVNPPAVEATPAKPTPWIGANPPWEEYCGLRVPVVDDGKIVSIVEMAGGKLKVTEPADIREREQDFEFGGNIGATVVFSQSNVDAVLLDEDTKVRAMEMSYKFDREDPVYHGIIQGYLNFIVGQGIKFKARDENPVVQEYLERFWRENAMDGKDTAWVRRYLKTGELAVRWFTKDAQGRAAAVPKARAVPFWRIVRVVKDADDSDRMISYDVTSGSRVGGAMILGETKVVPAEEMTLWHNGDPEEARGEPPFLAIMRATKWYADWLLNRVVLNRFRTSHVLFKKVKGSPNRVSGVVSGAPDAATHVGTGGKYEKRLPKMGTMVVHNDSIEYDWKAPNLGASDAATDGRSILTYIAAGAQVPEFLLGEASTANYASTLVAQNPFVRQVQFYQDLFSGIFGQVFRRVIEHGIATGAIPQTSTETVVKESGAIMRRVRRVLAALGIQEATVNGDLAGKNVVPTKTDVDITWPSLIHQDQMQEATTLQIHQAMGAVSTETIRQKLGYEHEVEERRLAAERSNDGDKFAADRDAEITAPGETPEPALEKPGLAVTPAVAGERSA